MQYMVIFQSLLQEIRLNLSTLRNGLIGLRRMVYILLLIPLFFVRLQRVNVADLLPVEAVAVYMDGDQVVLETDTAHVGTGKTVEEALASLKENTAKVIYLDTVVYLLVSEDAIEQVGSMCPYLKGSVKVGVCEAKGRVKDAAEYLSIHQKMPKLRQWKNKIENTERKRKERAFDARVFKRNQSKNRR